MKTIVSTILLILTLGNVWGQAVAETSKLHTEEFRNYHTALQNHSNALLEKLHSESEIILFKHHPAVLFTGKAAKEKLLRELCILDAIQKETEEYFFNQPPEYTYCIIGQRAFDSMN